MSEFKKGDKVFLVRGPYLNGAETYEEITKVISASKVRGDIRIDGYVSVFDKHGLSKGGGWGPRPRIVRATDALIEHVRNAQKRHNALAFLKDAAFEKMNNKELKQVTDLIESMDLDDRGEE